MRMAWKKPCPVCTEPVSFWHFFFARGWGWTYKCRHCKSSINYRPSDVLLVFFSIMCFLSGTFIVPYVVVALNMGLQESLLVFSLSFGALFLQTIFWKLVFFRFSWFRQKYSGKNS